MEFKITTADEIQPINKNTITVIIPVIVDDADALLAAQEAALAVPGGTFKNVAKISAYGVDNPIIGTDIPITEKDLENPLSFQDCSIYGLGVGYTVSRDAGKSVPLVFALSNVLSADNTDLVYTAKVLVPNYLDLIFDASSTTSVFGSVSNFFHGQSVIPTVITSATYDGIDPATGWKIVTIKYSHKGQFSGELLYINLNTITNAALENTPSTITNFYCPVYADLTYQGAATPNCSASVFTIVISLTNPDPSIDTGSKSIVIS